MESTNVISKRRFSKVDTDTTFGINTNCGTPFHGTVRKGLCIDPGISQPIAIQGEENGRSGVIQTTSNRVALSKGRKMLSPSHKPTTMIKTTIVTMISIRVRVPTGHVSMKVAEKFAIGQTNRDAVSALQKGSRQDRHLVIAKQTGRHIQTTTLQTSRNRKGTQLRVFKGDSRLDGPWEGIRGPYAMILGPDGSHIENGILLYRKGGT
mmetsp:Transcript_16855/g.38867  ORF Transcript_16855/g.38867 Transcript_16855/m.38867 type:complete len:208 (-) Transcript_16855:485-1108(-)